MSMHMIRGVQVHGSGKKKKRKKTESLLAAEKALKDTLKRVGYKGTIKPDKKPYVHDLGTTQRVTSDVIPDNGNKKETMVYTGTEIAGIAVMHKSNLVPVRKDNKEGFVEVATMRRN